MAKKFGIAWKLLTVCAAFALPIVVMFVLMTQAKLAEIEFTSKELQGDAFQRPLEDVLQHVSAHERLSARLSRGQRGPGLEARIRAEEHEVTAALKRLDAADRAHGQALQFTPEGLGLRKRGAFTAQQLSLKWQALLARRPLPSRDQQAEAYTDIVAHLRTMITHAGDASNLILDPDLDTYYLMDVTLLALPQMEDRVRQLALRVEARLGQAELGSAARSELATLAAFLREADWDRVSASTQTAFNEDQNFQGKSPSLIRELEPRLRRCDAAVARVLAGVGSLALAESTAAFDVRAFDADLDALELALYDFHRAALNEEDRLLQLRVAAFQRSLRIGCAAAGASLLFSALLAFALANDITRRTLRVSATTQAFAGGDMTVRVGSAGADELGELGQSFDDMANRIERLTNEVRQRAEQLVAVNAGLEATVEDRTRELRRRNDAFSLILDNAHDGMLTVDLHGRMSSERSAAVTRWFGSPRDGAALPDYLGAHDATFAAELALGLEGLRDELMPAEVVLEQLPKHAVVGGVHLQLTYEPILEERAQAQQAQEPELSRLLVVISDVTSEVANRRAAALQEETVSIFHACQRDRAGFIDFFVNAREIVQQLGSAKARPSVEVARDLHTLKGNCALFGVFSMSRLCHEIEDNMADKAGQLGEVDLRRLAAGWEELSLNVKQIVGDHAGNVLEVGDDEYAAIVDSVARGAPRRDILAAIARWKLEPTARRLNRFAERARDLGRRVGKNLEVDVEPNGLRVCAETWAPVWTALSHVIRNSVDHGIEAADERAEQGKTPEGHLRLSTLLLGDKLWIEVADDGRGIAWDSVAVRAASRGLAHATRGDLIEALFADGVSTADVVTELSGRGVGMSAVRDACQALGGSIEIDSESGRGTTIRCGFPQEVMGGLLSVIRDRPLTRSLAPP